MPIEAACVTALSTSPVKALRMQRRPRLLLERGGARGDRAMFIVDERARMVNAKHHPAFNQIIAELDDAVGLRISLPDGRSAAGEPVRGQELAVRFYSMTRAARLIDGPFSELISQHIGQPLRLVAFDDGRAAVDRGASGAVTLLSVASARAVAEAAGHREIDTRRFRMTIELDGSEAFAEDGWIGRELRLGGEGGPVIRPLGHVGRCNVTSLDPDLGTFDLPTLDLLREIRGELDTTEPLALGVHCAVLQAGEVAVGDALRIEG